MFYKVIDKNGPPPSGTGIKQLRENIAESKLSYEIMDDAAQAFLKTKIMDNIQVKDPTDLPDSYKFSPLMQ